MSKHELENSVSVCTQVSLFRAKVSCVGRWMLLPEFFLKSQLIIHATGGNFIISFLDSLRSISVLFQKLMNRSPRFLVISFKDKFLNFDAFDAQIHSECRIFLQFKVTFLRKP